jgi:hypothetical protein
MSPNLRRWTGWRNVLRGFKMAKEDEIFSSSKTKHNYYCFCTHQYIQAQLIFILMVQEFKKKPEAGRAQLISKWFLEQDIDTELSKNGFIDELTPLIHHIAGIRWRTWYNRLESHKV